MRCVYILIVAFFWIICGNGKLLEFDVPLTLKYGEKIRVLDRVYLDKHFAAFYDASVNKSITWPFDFLARAWQHALGNMYPSIYGDIPPISIGPGTRTKTIFLILVSSGYRGCLVLPDYYQIQRLPLLDDYDECREDEPSFLNEYLPNGSVSNQTLMFYTVEIIKKMLRHETFETREHSSCYPSMGLIMIYDMFATLYNNWNEETAPWKELVKSNSDHDTQCFESFLVPIWNKFGNASLKWFLKFNQAESLLGSQKWDLGRFVHTWSGAVGENVQSIAASAFQWTSKHDRQLAKARKNYPYFVYSLSNRDESPVKYILPLSFSNLTETFFLGTLDPDATVLLSVPEGTDLDSGFFEDIQNLSVFWKYLETQLGPFGLQSPLNVVLYSTNITKEFRCVSSNTGSYFDKLFDPYRVISCNEPDSESKRETATITLLFETAKMAMKLSNKTGNWPAVQVSGWSMALAVLTDFVAQYRYSREGEGPTYEDGIYEVFNIFHADDLATSNHIFRNGSKKADWYFEMYQYHGKGQALSNFVQRLHSHWPKFENDFEGQLNLGNFVHFWSSAVTSNLKDTATRIFNWTDKHEEMFLKSRLVFSKLNDYPCVKCDSLSQKTKNTSTQDTTGMETTQSTSTLIVGIFISLLIISAGVFGATFWFKQKKIQQLRSQIRSLNKEEIDGFKNGNLENNEGDANASFDAKAFNCGCEIPRDRLVIDNSNKLGSGEFGVVRPAILKADDSAGSADVRVAVKQFKPNVDVSYFKAFLTEIKIMASLGKHENVVSLLGAVTTNIRKRQVLVALELCEKGDLLQYLRKFENNFDNLWIPNLEGDLQSLGINPLVTTVNASNEVNTCSTSCGTVPPISTLNLLGWSTEIANGMAYLSAQKVIHGDLAARNVLLTDTAVAKISDFGLSRQLVKYSVYLKTSKIPVPWKWLSVEALETQRFSVHSDVWSFGVTLWEIFTLGKTPYPGRTMNDAFVNDLNQGLRPQSPKFGNTEIYNLMMKCMRKKPLDRISFSDIMTQIETIKNNTSQPAQSTSNEDHYLVLEQPEKV